MISLVGYTGFVGSNIYLKAGNKIEGLYNSKNIKEAYGTNPDLLIYAGLRAEKYLANNAPEKDLELIEDAKTNIKNINPKRLVLISTIDVFKTPLGVDETTVIDTDNLHPYGYNRFLLEEWVRENYKDALIVRLPGLFGRNIKKNFIYDFINVIPFMLKEGKFTELSIKDNSLADYYEKLDNGFYRVKELTESEKIELRNIFKKLSFSALNFTDSRSIYQFYNLSNLWDDINTALNSGITLWHPATEPVSAAEVYKYLTNDAFINELNSTPANYDYRTIHGGIFGGRNGYICDKDMILSQIMEFVNTYE